LVVEDQSMEPQGFHGSLTLTLKSDAKALQGKVDSPQSPYEPMATTQNAVIAALQSELRRVKDKIGRPWDPAIVSTFPEIFVNFRGRRFSRLLACTPDRLRALGFFPCCIGHVSILTVIVNTKANVFGSFTPMKWASTVHGRATL
jgi:hypothetical protein